MHVHCSGRQLKTFASYALSYGALIKGGNVKRHYKTKHSSFVQHYP